MNGFRNQILIGDCLESMRTMPDSFVQCCVTSPPYFALRSYLPPGHPDKAKEIGSEPTPDAFVATMVAVFREVRRVLRDDGVLFMNLGDSYASAGGQHEAGSSDGATGRGPRGKRQKENSGQLMCIPHRVALALQSDGWNLRQTIIWAKKSPMPESLSGPRWERCRVKVGHNSERAGQSYKSSTPGKGGKLNRDCIGGEWIGGPVYEPCPGCPKCLPNGGWVFRNGKGRCTTAHEYVFVFSKSERYFWDSEASKEAALNTCTGRTHGKKADGAIAVEVRSNGSFGSKISGVGLERRNPRSVWTLSTEPTKEKHFATFPSELVRRCLVAGCSAGGCCAHCGKPWAPMIERDRVATRPGLDNKIWKHEDGDKIGQRSESSPNLDPQRHIAITNCHGYRQSCNCPAHEPAKQIVFDPFSGLCTVQQTARQLGHDWLGCELNPTYAAIGIERIEQPPRWLLRQQAAAKKKPKPAPVTPGQLSLFAEEIA